MNLFNFLYKKEKPVSFILKNEDTGKILFLPTGNWPKYYLMDKVHIGDVVLVKYLKKEIHVTITMITAKGVGCATGFGYQFIKWKDVISKKFTI